MTKQSEDFYRAYEDYSKTLRTWLVAYGVGAPVLILNNDEAFRRLLASPNSQCILTAFLVGVTLQVLITAINKTAMWVCYFTEHEDDGEEAWWRVLANWISRQFWMDLLADVGSLIAFSIGTWQVYRTIVTG